MRFGINYQTLRKIMRDTLFGQGSNLRPYPFCSGLPIFIRYGWPWINRDALLPTELPKTFLSNIDRGSSGMFPSLTDTIDMS